MSFIAKTKLNNKGFSHLEIGISIVVVAVIAVVGGFVYSRNNNKSKAMTVGSSSSVQEALGPDFSVGEQVLFDTNDGQNNSLQANSASNRFRIGVGVPFYCRDGSKLRWGVWIEYKGRHPVQTNAYVRVLSRPNHSNEKKNFVRPADRAYARKIADTYGAFVTYMWFQNANDPGLVRLQVVDDYGKPSRVVQFRIDEKAGSKACNPYYRSIFTN